MDFQRLGLHAYYHETISTYTVEEDDDTTTYRLTLAEDDQLDDILILLEVPEWVSREWRRRVCEGYTHLEAVEYHEQDTPDTPDMDVTVPQEVPVMNDSKEDDFRPKPPVFELQCPLPNEPKPPERRSLLQEYISGFNTPEQEEEALQKFTERAGDLTYHLCPHTPTYHQHAHAERTASDSPQAVRTNVSPRILNHITPSLTGVSVNGREVRM